MLFHSIPEFREFGRANLVNAYAGLQERTLSMINLTAEQRYENLIASQPEIFQHSPLKYIASYLGVTDSSLSRIRKDFVSK
jgi:CRP-like cAMP-binding protein